jgi:hypothetical protein
MLVHLSDLANPSRPWHLALKWAEQVVTEFLGQVRDQGSIRARVRVYRARVGVYRAIAGVRAYT